MYLNIFLGNISRMNPMHNTLIETGLLDTKTLAEALLEQLKSTPPAISILFDKGLITPKQVVEILELQELEALSLKQACDALALWNDDFQEVISAANRKPLSKILLDSGAVDPKSLLQNLEAISNNLDTSDGTFELKLVKAPDASISTVDGFEFEPVFFNAEEVIASPIIDYVDLFNDEKHEQMEEEVLSLRTLASELEIDETLDSIFRNYHSLKGASRSISAPITGEIIHLAEDLIAFFKTHHKSLSKDDFSTLITINLQVVDMIWELRNRLEAEKTEESFWTDPDSQSQFIETASKITHFNNELESRGLSVDLDEMEDLF